MAPKYAHRGHLFDKADVFSFGVVVLEVVHGKSNSTHRSDSKEFYFVDWVLHLWKQNNLAQFVDPHLQRYDNDEVLRTIKVVILCTSRAATDKPPMSAVVSMLEGELAVEVEMQMAVLSDEEQAPDLLRVIAEIDAKFKSQEITETL